MKLRIWAIVLMLMGSVSLSWAEEVRPQPDKKARQAIGTSIGFTGNGMMFRQYLGNSYLQGSGYAFYNQDNNNKYANLAFSAASYLHYLDLSEYFFPVALKFIMGLDWEVGRDDRINGVNVENNYLHTGAGFGLEIGKPNQPGLVISLDLLYIASMRDGDKKVFSADFNDLVFIEPRPAASIFYNW